MRLIWNAQQGLGVINNGNKEWPLIAPPALSFAIQGLFYDDDRGHYLHLRDGGGQEPMTDAQKVEILAWVAQQDEPADPGLNVADKQNELVNAVQQHLDDTARTRGYDSILSLCSYVNSGNATFAAEAQAGMDWRDAVWAHCNQVLADVQAGTRPIPTAVELILELPEINW